MSATEQFPLFETIAVQDSVLQNIAAHQQRYQTALCQYFGKLHHIVNLSEITVPKPFQKGLVRCRIDYNATQIKTQFSVYQRRSIRSFHPVVCNEIDYHLKYSDRTVFNRLLAQKGDCDEIMIIKHGMVTDCSIGNLILRQGDVWYTPDTPLLAGTQRQKLLKEHRIVECSIPFVELENFTEIRLINALNDLSV